MNYINTRNTKVSKPRTLIYLGKLLKGSSIMNINPSVQVKVAGRGQIPNYILRKEIFHDFLRFHRYYNSCDRLSSLSKNLCRIGYAKNINQYTTHHVLLLSLSSTDLYIPKSAMINTYQEQKKCPFLFIYS